MFKPNDLTIQTSKYTLENLLGSLNVRFQKLVDSGWYKEWYKDRIFVQVARSQEPSFYDSILSLRTELTNAYLAAGWGKAIIETSGEKGERDGILSIRLFKDAEKKDLEDVNANAEELLAAVSDIKQSLTSLNIQRSQQGRFDAICESLSSIERIANTL